VIVFVDPRLIRDDPSTTISGLEMRLWLAMYGSDLFKDGYFPYFVAADVYHGEAHQDGRTLLAMRRFLKDVHRHYPLAGTLLIGSFPEASIVRTVMARNRPDSFTFTNSRRSVNHTDQLDVVSELLTPRGEIVLADLDGNWESLYREQLVYTDYQLLPTTTAYPAAGQVLDTADYTATRVSYADVFFVDDAPPILVSEGGGQLHMAILDLEERNPELAPDDGLENNRIARPEIVVSRINTRHVAIVPTAPTDLDGKTSPLGPDGKPQTLRYSTLGQRVSWVRSHHLERKLLTDYLARQHRFRLGHDNDKPFRTSAVRQEGSGLKPPDSFNAMLRGAASGFGTSLSTEAGRLLHYIDWLKQPAVLRGIASHSTETESLFGPSDDFGALESALGGKPWRWESSAVGNDWVLTPTLANGTVGAAFSLYRTMWENGALAGAGQFFTIHDGCDVNVPSNARNVPYNHPTYGHFSASHAPNGESLLFYANGLALMGRSKIFSDTPEGVVEAIKSWDAFGQGWAGYFFHDAANGGLDERRLPYGVERRTRTLNRKRSYFWNVIGDWTLQLRYP
jgi:hypothetical protein